MVAHLPFKTAINFTGYIDTIFCISDIDFQHTHLFYPLKTMSKYEIISFHMFLVKIISVLF